MKKICGFFNRLRELNDCRIVSALWSALSLLCSFVQKLTGWSQDFLLWAKTPLHTTPTHKRWQSSKWPPNNANTKRDLLQLTTACNSSGNVHHPTHTTHTCVVQSRCVLVDEKIYPPNKKNYLLNLSITWLVDIKHTWALLISFAGLWQTSNKCKLCPTKIIRWRLEHCI